jgi:uncharacterized protein
VQYQEILMTSRLYVSAALLAAVCAIQTVARGASDAQSLYLQGIKAQSGAETGGTAIDLKGAQALLEQAAAAGSAAAMQRLGDMYHDGDGGVAKDYAKALEWYKNEAALDDSHPGSGAMGMIALGEMFAKGHGVALAKDQAQSDEWFKKALASAKVGADKGDTAAMIALAYCLAEGKGSPGIKSDPVTAWAWAIKSVQTPNPWSYEIIASFYSQGIGVKADPSLALSNVLRAAQMGVSRDMVAVSLSFASGMGVKKDEKAAIEWINKAVDRGDSRAMGILGKYYHEEVGLKRSDLTAKEWYQKAIDQGDEAALGYMGDMFISPGVNPRDTVSAISWFQKGTAVGDAYSMFQLARLLVYDPDVRPDINRAGELLNQSWNLGFADSMATMGELYRDGKLPGTLDDAIARFRKAAEAGSITGMRDLGESLANQAEGASRYVAGDDDKTKMAEAFGWLKKAADAGDLEAMADVGETYMKGKGVNSSINTATTWYRKAAEAGNVRAMRNLGQFYMSNPVYANYGEAKKWFEKAIEKGDPASLSGLAEMYDNALGVPEDNAEAFRLYRKAAEGGDGGGYRGLAQYLLAAGDYRQAAAYYQAAAERNDMRAIEALGTMYELGQGVEKNPNRALELYTQAMNMGSQSAWSKVFSKTATTTGPSTMSGNRPPPLDLPDLTGNLNQGRGPGRGPGREPGSGGPATGPGGPAAPGGARGG